MKQRSKRLAWTVVFISTALAAYAVYQGLEGAAVAFYSTGIPAAIALYANRQYQNRKYEELKTVSPKNSNDNLEKDWDKVK